MTLDLNTVGQWLAIISSAGLLWWRFGQRDKDRDGITKWRVHVNRDIEALQKQVGRLEDRKGRIFDRLESISQEISKMSERLVRIESRINGVAH